MNGQPVSPTRTTGIYTVFASGFSAILTWLLRPHPSLDSKLAQRRSQLLAGLMAVMLFFAAVGLGWQFLVNLEGVLDSIDTWIIGACSILACIAFFVNRAGHTSSAARMVILLLAIAFVVVPFTPEAVNDLIFFAILPILITGLFFSASTTIAVAAILTLTVAILDLLYTQYRYSWETFFLVMSSSVIVVFMKHIQFQEHLRSSELEDINHKLKVSEENLERRVAERTRDLQVAADVSVQITTMFESGQLLAEIAERMAAAFNLHSVRVFLYELGDNSLRYSAGFSSAGHDEAARALKFSMGGQALIVQAARQMHPILVNDVERDPSYAPAALKPNTRAVLAVPMVYLGKLMGVLDLQSQFVNRFTDDDIRIMKTLAE